MQSVTVTTSTLGCTTLKRKARSVLLHPACKPLLFAMCVIPIVWLIYGAFSNNLGANPAEKLIRATGDWTLRFLCLTLSVTPLRRWTNQPALIRFRRMLGVFTFFYACMHFLCYSWLDMGLMFDDIVRDILKRPFILVGTGALLLMTPLALTSFNRAIRILGAKNWQSLHRVIYLVVLLGLLHFFWMRSAKHDYAEVLTYATLVAALLGSRLLTTYRIHRDQETDRKK